MEVAEDGPEYEPTHNVEDISFVEHVGLDFPENAEFIFEGRHKDMLEPEGNVKKDILDIMGLLSLG